MTHQNFYCTACKCSVPSHFQVRTAGCCFMCDPAVTLAECLSENPFPDKPATMTHTQVMQHRADWKADVPHIAWMDGTVTAVATRPAFQSHMVYVAQQLVGHEPTEGLARHLAEAEAKRRKIREIEQSER